MRKQKKSTSELYVLPVLAVVVLLVIILLVTILRISQANEYRTQQKFFEKNRSAFEEIKQLALEEKLAHNSKCASDVAFEIPQNYTYLFQDPGECLVVQGTLGNKIVEIPVYGFYNPIVYAQTPEKYADKHWDIDGFDLMRKLDLGDNWFVTVRDHN